MEMRSPFEAYVRLWEELSGKKDIRAPEKACAKLEAYFTSSKAVKKDEQVSVVLLDEIDYLVTEKQTVLYNFFDWPKRATELDHGRRLIVVGISNTLNLAEQLMPSVQSRIGSEKCSFRAYNLNDTIAILKSKIQQAAPVSELNPERIDMISVRTIQIANISSGLCCFRRRCYHIRGKKNSRAMWRYSKGVSNMPGCSRARDAGNRFTQ